MGLTATDVMPPIKAIPCFIFIPPRSVAACLVAIARPRDFAVLLRSRSSLPPSIRKSEMITERRSSTRRRAVMPPTVSRRQCLGSYSFSTDTSVALIIAKTVSPSVRFIRFTEPVVMIEVMWPASVRMATSDTTLSETIFSIVPRKRFRMLVLIPISF